MRSCLVHLLLCVDDHCVQDISALTVVYHVAVYVGLQSPKGSRGCFKWQQRYRHGLAT